MTAIAWRRTDLPPDLLALPEELHLWAKGLYNACAIAGVEAPVQTTIQRMQLATKREQEKADARARELSDELVALSAAGANAPESVQQLRKGVEQAIEANNARRSILALRSAVLAKREEEVQGEPVE